MNIHDLTGRRFGRLTVIQQTDQRGPDGGIIYECLCDCGNKCLVWGNKLTRKGHSAKRSCGCLHDETHPQHGGSKSLLYHKWKGMQDRCYNPNARQYPDYGGRGIRVCGEWRMLGVECKPVFSPDDCHADFIAVFSLGRSTAERINQIARRNGLCVLFQCPTH